MNKRFLRENRPTDAPSEVQEVWVYQMVGHIGRGTWERLYAIIKKYPTWFPWETLYNTIPKEVHRAYTDEKREAYIAQWQIAGGKGIWEQMQEVHEHRPLRFSTLKDMVNYMTQLREEEEEQRRIKLEKDRQLWDKHYSKYGLEYRE